MSVKAVPATLHLLQLPKVPSTSCFDARYPPTTPTIALASIITTTTNTITITIALSRLASTSVCAA
ncbi:hypothetical protein A9Z42_0089410 [Trichoderma parareesei]|uniref:Uncharacterized protein n=1 Tax=Trichoderma parareesei TaxID=858221 RepID=A0A2H2ZYB6_TRIPA|nr:hypothetical protein A9Z42_0089410 [Trichoderma parareesei]